MNTVKVNRQTEELPCQKAKFTDSAWHAEIGGW